MKQPMTAQTLCALRFVSQPRFSPDGRVLAFVEQGARANREGYEGDLYVSIDAGAPVRLTAGGDASGLCFTPAGTLLFPALREQADKDRAARKECLSVYYEISPFGGEAVRAFELPYAAAELTALDDDRFFFTARVDARYPDRDAPDFEEKLKEWSAPTYRALEESPFWFNGKGFTDGTRCALFVYERASQTITRVTDACFDVQFVSTDGTRLVYIGTAYDKVADPFNTGLYLYDPAKKEGCTLLAPGVLQLEFAYLRGADEVLLCGTRGERYGHNQSGALFTLSVGSGAPHPLGDAPIVPTLGHVGTDARLGGGQTACMYRGDFYFITLRGTQNVLCRLDASGRVHELLVAPHGMDAFDVCDGHIAYTLLSNDALPEVYLDGRQLTQKSRLLNDLALSVPEYTCCQAKDGTLLDGFVIRPVGYTPGTRYPALLEIHGGPRTAFGDPLFHEMQMFAGAGYFVFYCNPRGSDGKGDAFADIWGRYGSIDYDDLMAFTDHVLARVPDIDPARVGVLGGSYGGYMTNWIIGHTDRFAAACSQRSIANWISFESTSDIGAHFTRSQHKTSMFEDVDTLWDISPLKYASACKTPTLFIHSDHDFRCFMVEGIQMFTALKMHGVPARLCLFADETHELSRSGRPENRVSRLTEMLGWFDTYLKEGKCDA